MEREGWMEKKRPQDKDSKRSDEALRRTDGSRKLKHCTLPRGAARTTKNSGRCNGQIAMEFCESISPTGDSSLRIGISPAKQFDFGFKRITTRWVVPHWRRGLWREICTRELSPTGRSGRFLEEAYLESEIWYKSLPKTAQKKINY